jgi:hypothetical protein
MFAEAAELTRWAGAKCRQAVAIFNEREFIDIRRRPFNLKYHLFHAYSSVHWFLIASDD